MCEYCYGVGKHHPACPNAPQLRVIGQCAQCGEELTENYEYYVDSERNEFCSKDCAMEYHGVVAK